MRPEVEIESRCSWAWGLCHSSFGTESRVSAMVLQSPHFHVISDTPGPLSASLCACIPCPWERLMQTSPLCMHLLFPWLGNALPVTFICSFKVPSRVWIIILNPPGSDEKPLYILASCKLHVTSGCFYSSLCANSVKDCQTHTSSWAGANEWIPFGG